LATALHLGVALKALLLHQGFAVMGASGDAAPPAEEVSAVADGLRESGANSLAGRELRFQLLGDAQPLGELSEALAALYARALAAYDEGAYADAARDAEAAFQSLGSAFPSTRREALARQVRLLWGASLVQLHEGAAARAHFRWALERDPFLIADRDRFPPPVQRAVEHERTAVAAEAPARLVVSVAGAPSGGPAVQLIVDGLPRGSLPRELSLPAHAATFWVEGAPQGGWAHQAALAPDHTLSVDLDLLLEAALFAGDGQILIQLPAATQKRQALLGAVMARSRMTDLVLVSKVKPSGAVQRLTATRFNAAGVALARTAFDADQASSLAVAQALRGLPLVAVAQALRCLPPPKPAAAIPAESSVEKKGDGFPVLPVVLGAAAVVVVAAVLTAVFWPRSFEVTLTPSQR
jgi:hypothetical protein